MAALFLFLEDQKREIRDQGSFAFPIGDLIVSDLCEFRNSTRYAAVAERCRVVTWIARKEPFSMICDDVKRVAYFFLDGSMGERKQTDFKTHVSICPDCEQRVSIHRRLRNFIAKRLGRDSAPQSLRQRLSRSFRALRSDTPA